MVSPVHDILGVRIDDLSPFDLRETMRGWLHGTALRTVVTPNPEFVLRTRRNPAFRDLLNRADVRVPDAVGLAYAVAALTDGRLAHRQTGVDLVEELAALCAKEGKSLMLFGGLPGSAKSSADALRERYPTLNVRAHEAGSVRVTDAAVEASAGDLEAIRLYKPDAIAVALGQEKQERFIFERLPAFPSVRVAVGVGGAFEMISGRLPRAPGWMRRAGLEWAWRLRLEPRRLPRIFRAAVLFPCVIVAETIRQRRFPRACLSVLRLIFTAD